MKLLAPQSMRPRKEIPATGTVKTTISLPADVIAFGLGRAKKRDQAFSAYVRFLIRNDRRTAKAE